MTPNEEFERRNREMIVRLGEDAELRELTRRWFARASRHEYSYHFRWMGRPVIQFPQDLVATQEILWNVKPDLVIETGVAHGGSLIFYASILELIGKGRVVGIDIDIRAHNRAAIEAHPMFRRIELIEGSSVDDGVFARVRAAAEGQQTVLVALDSNHTHEHVLAELRLYSQLVTPGSYLIAFDTIVEQMPEEFSAGRPWKPGDNPATAVAQFLKETDRFAVDEEIDRKLLISVAPGGYLRCLRP
jgi:cephalosporin hydroxylase